MTRFILHVGDMKCGTTSVQASLANAKAALRANGVIYDVSETGINHCDLVRLARPTSNGNLDAELERGRRILSLLAQAEVGPSDTIVLSAENLLPLPPRDFWPILREIAPTGPLEVHVIAYIRAPSDMYISHVQQMLKSRQAFTPPDQYNRPVAQFLRAWRDAPEVASIRVRRFDRTALTKGDVVADFASQLAELVEHVPPLSAKTKNQSLTAEQCVVLQRLRREILPDFEGQFHPVSARFTQWSQRMNALGALGAKLKLNEVAHNIVEARNAPVMHACNQDFPELRMPVVSPSEVLPAWKGGTDLRDILLNCDGQDVDAIAQLVPELNTNLPKGIDETALRAIERLVLRPERTMSEPEAVELHTRYLRRIRNYWRESGCTEAANQLHPAKMAKHHAL